MPVFVVKYSVFFTQIFAFRWPSPAVLHRRKTLNLNASHSAPSRLFRASMNILPDTPQGPNAFGQRIMSSGPRRLILDSP